MNVKEAINSALSSVLSNKMRSILTMLGIIIGISSVILITSLGNGVNKSVTEEFEKMGYNGLDIYTNNYGLYDIREEDKITLEDMDTIRKHEAISAVTSFTSDYADVKNRNNELMMLNVIATDSAFTNVRALDINAGRFLQESDIVKAGNVIVIEDNLSVAVFGHTDTIGKKISVEFDETEAEFTIIGIIDIEDTEGGTSLLGAIPTSAYIPFQTYIDITGEDIEDLYLNTAASVEEGYDLDEVAEEVKKILGILHNTDPEKYIVQDIMAGVSQLSTIFTGITLFISFVAGISLFVGGVGVMNIMLVTVTERTREIGIRKSLGATNGNIQFQFLIEAIILTFIGGVIGIILGYFGSIGVGKIISIEPAISIPVIAGVVIISSLVGIIFGVYPANKAAKLDPIEALRYE